MKSTPEGGIDFTALASQYRVIPASPAYEAVVVAIDRLRASKRSGRRHATWAADADTVREFRALVERNATTLAHVLTLADAIGRMKRRSRPASIGVGLDLLSSAYRFAGRSETEMADVVTKIATQISKRYAEAGAGKVELSRDGGGKMSPSSFSKRLDESFGALGALKINEDALVKIRDAAWESCLTRLAGNSAEPDVAELLAASSERMTSVLVPFDLGTLRIRQLSSLAVLSSANSGHTDAGYTPAIVGDLALAALGFQTSDGFREIGAEQRLAQVAQQALERLARRPSSDRIIWVIPGRRESAATDGVMVSSLLDGFTPSGDPIACLGIDQDLFRRSRREVRLVLDRIGKQHQLTLAIEVAPDENEESVEARTKEVRRVTNPPIPANVAQIANVSLWRGAVGPVYVYASPPPSPLTPFVVAPRSLDVIVRAAWPEKSAV
jgi:hypothetical protein